MQPVAAAPARARLPEIPAASVRSAVISILLPLALLFVAVLVQQIAAGTYRAEFSGEPDEAAHYMTA